MAVLVEAISVIVRCDAIERKFRGGWQAFLTTIPNATLCTDDELARVGFMTPEDVGDYIHTLNERGLTFVDQGRPVDVVVVDQQRGPTVNCDWLEFAPLRCDEEGRVSACWLAERPRSGAGLHVPRKRWSLATPEGWKFEGSLSQQFRLVPTGQRDERLQFLRHDDGVDVYLDRETGKQVYVGRA